MCTYMPVSEVVKLPINWVRGDDKRLKTVFKSLKKGDGFKQPIKLLRYGCGKTYMLEDGGHRITAAHNSKVFEELIADGDLKQGCEVQADKAYRSKRHDAI